MVYTGKSSPKQPARVRFLTENTGLSLHEIARKHEISKSSVARMCNTNSDQRSLVEKVTRKSGRPRKISERDCRAVIRGLQRLRLRGGDVTVKTVVQESGCSFQKAHRRTFLAF